MVCHYIYLPSFCPIQANFFKQRSCALNGRILSLRQDTSNLHYRAIFPQSASASVSGSPQKTADGHDDDTEQLIKDYFNLSIDLTRLYEQWSSRDAHFSKKSTQFAGIRMLRQDPWENLVSFICSTNNNIARISQMVLFFLRSWVPPFFFLFFSPSFLLMWGYV